MLFWVPVAGVQFTAYLQHSSYFSLKKFCLYRRKEVFFSEVVSTTPAFTFHIAAGAFALALHWYNSPGTFWKSKAIHRISGKNLCPCCTSFPRGPTGLYMSFFAKGSFWERALFMFMAIGGLLQLYMASALFIKRNVIAHKIWMMRSYSMAMTAVTFRVYHIMFYLSLGHLENYEISLWISVIGNMLFAEWIIYRQSKNYLKSFAVS